MDILTRDDERSRGTLALEDDVPSGPGSERRKDPSVNKRPLDPPPMSESSLMGLDNGMSLMGGSNTLDPVWQRLWLRCQQHDWQSLAFIGSSKRDPDGVLVRIVALVAIAQDETRAIRSREFARRLPHNGHDSLDRAGERKLLDDGDEAIGRR